jgi:HPt (histidine-containing phosphotransfer) domain-containing protein
MEGFANKPIDYPALTREIARVKGIQEKDVAPSAEVPAKRYKNTPTRGANMVVDVDKALQLLGEREVHLHEVGRFITNSEEQVKNIISALIEGDDKMAASLAHAMKGVAGNLSLTTLFTVCRNIEQSAKKNELNIVLVEPLRSAFNELTAWYSAQGQTEATTNDDHVNGEELICRLTKLCDSVNKNMLDENELEEIEAMPAGRFKEDVTAVLFDINDFEFENAEQKIQALINSINESYR